MPTKDLLQTSMKKVKRSFVASVSQASHEWLLRMTKYCVSHWHELPDKPKFNISNSSITLDLRFSLFKVSEFDKKI